MSRALQHSLRPLRLALLAWLTLSNALARAQDPCGGVRLGDGQVLFAKPPPPEALGSDSGRACRQEIATQLQANRLIRAITVSYRSDDAQRMNGQALALAKRLAAGLVAAGLPSSRVFAVAPPTQPGQPSSLAIRYTERAPDTVLARLTKFTGTVHIGPSEATVVPAAPAMPLLPDDIIRTGKDSVAGLEFHDGSGVRLAPQTQIKLLQMQFGEDGSRVVKLEVQHGEIESFVRKAGVISRFDISSRIAVASVRGTELRFLADPQGRSQLETLVGSVALGNSNTGGAGQRAPSYVVKAGFGSRVHTDGTVEKPRPLPKTPQILAPLQGVLPSSGALLFAAIPDAVEYRIELARDADFLTEPRQYSTTQTAFAVPQPLPAGKWFFRVTARDAAGFSSVSSKVYAFAVTP